MDCEPPVDGHFDPAGVRQFQFSGYEFDPAQGQLRLAYQLDNTQFVETISYPSPDGANINSESLERACRLAHWLAGISYFKAALPPKVTFDGPGPGPESAALLTQFYRQGLGEMVWRSGLTLPSKNLIQAGPTPTRPAVVGGAGVVVPLGGGKDSLVTCSLLTEAGIRFRTIAVGSSPLIKAMAEKLQKEGFSDGHLQISRTLDPRLMALNGAGAYNGHVPITGILAGIMLVAGLLYGFDTVVMSNERSADAANLYLPDGEAVNHQYSKSADFEYAFQHAVGTEVLRGFRYFSLLRGTSEIVIARHFSTLSAWFEDFSSCNQNFRQDGVTPAGRWCGDCPKCRFVFLALAPQLAPAKLTAIFGKNLLDSPHQLAGYRALCGLGDHKPFECIGEVEESAALMKALGKQVVWREAGVVQQLRQEVASAAELDHFDQIVAVPSIPAGFAEALSRL